MNEFLQFLKFVMLLKDNTHASLQHTVSAGDEDVSYMLHEADVENLLPQMPLGVFAPSHRCVCSLQTSYLR